VIDDESPAKTRANTCLSYAPGVPSYSVAWVTNGIGVLGGWSSSLISKIWWTVMNSGH
jgi:hypothetical protein